MRRVRQEHARPIHVRRAQDKFSAGLQQLRQPRQFGAPATLSEKVIDNAPLRTNRYDDLLPLWAEARYHPMLFSRAAVEKAAESRLRLAPARQP